MPQKINLIYRLTGDAVNEGINVFELSPLLMSIGTLIQEGQEITHPYGKKLGVNIKPFEEGSFIIELSVFAQNNLQQVLDMTNNTSTQEVNEDEVKIVNQQGEGIIVNKKVFSLFQNTSIQQNIYIIYMATF